ncbi:FAD-binding oxidoreductase [Hymenobacter aerilatus]|uniref:FAD-binding oxidoreductase n=1 Tax=Hymenobacter aerilatus TaxID=2932251 RepID=A0A8T9T692_9BACT|nr:FAD-binding oxidoreductase [Hymenobacter aerilatus]UOR07586.1 FAD-binding oxidoreductase [Hymenobacter aerilatus]
MGGRPAHHLWQAYTRDAPQPLTPQPGIANDVSGLNATAMRTVAVAADSAAALRQLRQLLDTARARHLPVAIAGAQHSMGGHTVAAGGMRLVMRPFRYLHLDTVSNLLTVGSGAHWADVIPYLNRHGRAVATMQSDNAFSIGGSLSVNCHGWQPNQPPIAATVESMRVLLADGRLLTCSRQQNQQLFRLTLGGYGLFGIIIDARLRTVPNALYTYQRVAGPAEEYLVNYRRYVDANPRVQLAYGRLNVTKEHFLEESTLNFFVVHQAASPYADLPEPGLANLKRAVFVGSKRDAYGKQLRWDLEQVFTRNEVGKTFSRNQIMNESPALYLNRSTGQTDILHEYFIPARHYNHFRRVLQRCIPRHQADLLNVTLRNVYADHDTFLPYAREEVFGFVLFFNQALTPAAEADMIALTRKLITEAERLGGTYYLPYRLHATPAQLQRAYPRFQEFLQLKQKYDPQAVFQNQFYQQYRVETRNDQL